MRIGRQDEVRTRGETRGRHSLTLWRNRTSRPIGTSRQDSSHHVGPRETHTPPRPHTLFCRSRDRACDTRCQNGEVPVDLNADLGESFGRWRLGDDDAMLTMITSANVACGFHAGDPTTLRRTCRSAVERGVVIGAQVGYPDLVGFGRRFLDIAADDLAAAVIYQIGALDALARSVGGAVALREAPRRSLQRDRRPRGPGRAPWSRRSCRLDDRLPLLGLPGLGRAGHRGTTGTADGHRVLRRPQLHRRRSAGRPAPPGRPDHRRRPGRRARRGGRPHRSRRLAVPARRLSRRRHHGERRSAPRCSTPGSSWCRSSGPADEPAAAAVRGARAAARVRGPDRDRRRAAGPAAARPRRGHRDRARSADDLPAIGAAAEPAASARAARPRAGHVRERPSRPRW